MIGGVKYTITPWVQAQVASNGPALQRQPVLREYFDDVELGPKFHLSDQTNFWPALVLSTVISLPTAAAPGYLRTYDLLSTAFLSKDIGPVHFDLNFGFNLWRFGEPVAQCWGALAATAQLTPRWAAMAEVYGFTSASPVSDADAGLLLAVSIAPMPWLVCDIGGIISADRGASLGTILTPPITSVDLVSCMPKPLPAVVRLDSIPSALCNASQGVAGPRSMLAYVLFLKSPARLNGIEIV